MVFWERLWFYERACEDGLIRLGTLIEMALVRRRAGATRDNLRAKSNANTNNDHFHSTLTSVANPLIWNTPANNGLPPTSISTPSRSSLLLLSLYNSPDSLTSPNYRFIGMSFFRSSAAIHDEVDEILSHSEIRHRVPNDTFGTSFNDENRRPFLVGHSTFLYTPSPSRVFDGSTLAGSPNPAPIRQYAIQDEAEVPHSLFPNPSSVYDESRSPLPSFLPSPYVPGTSHPLNPARNQFALPRDVRMPLEQRMETLEHPTQNQVNHSAAPTISQPIPTSVIQNPSLKDSMDGFGLKVAGSRVAKSRPVCTKCNPHKYFSRNHNLKIHQRIHSGEKPYVCPVANCAKEYKWKSSIISHLSWHRRQGDVVEATFPQSRKNVGSSSSFEISASKLGVHPSTSAGSLRNNHLQTYPVTIPTTTNTSTCSFPAPMTKSLDPPCALPGITDLHRHAIGVSSLQTSYAPGTTQLASLTKFIPSVPQQLTNQSALVESGVIHDLPNEEEDVN